MVAGIPAGGNWQNIPAGLSARVDQIRKRSEERGLVHTTYYGRLQWREPSYTINTYFSRMGNGCFIHPTQTRLISLREGARLQSFPDAVNFSGSRRAQYEQIGNAVPPLLSHAVARTLEPGQVADLFCGAGGLSMGFQMAGSQVVYATDSSEHACTTFNRRHGANDIAEQTDLSDIRARRDLVKTIRARAGGDIDILLAGPPCQGFSTAGARSRQDPRSSLLWVPFEIARKLRPKVLVVENVHGILSIARRSLPKRIADEMVSLGLTPHMCVLRAEEFGVPQRRTRVFFVGLREGSWQPPQPCCSRSSGSDLLPAPLTVREAISDLPTLAAGAGKEEANLRKPAKSDLQRWARGEIHVSSLLATRMNAEGSAALVA